MEAAEVKFTPGYNTNYTKDDDLASVIATNIMVNIGIFDRITVFRNQVIGEKFCVGKSFSKVSCKFFNNILRNSDPYLVEVSWYYNDNQVALDEIISELHPSERKAMLFHINYLGQKEINLNEYDKMGN